MSLLALLNKFPLACIYILVDHKSKIFHLGFSAETAITALATTLTELRRGTAVLPMQESYNRGDLEIEILESYESVPLPQIIRAKASQLTDKYKADGYTDMRNSTGACYTLNKRILTNYLSANKPPLVYITARSGSCGEVVMAIFNTVPQADLWIELTYGSSRKGIVPTFKDDELTLGYHKEHGYKLKMGKTRVRGKLKQRFKGITL